MPSLLAILLLLIIYVMTLDGAIDGVKAYLVPDFSQAVDLPLIISALGQAFFSMSLGVGTMLIYGSYISKQENISSLGISVTLIDIGIAVLAGLLIIPAMYVAQHNGVVIYDSAGQLIAEDRLIFTVLPALFDTMGAIGLWVALAFFILMTIASLTSSISMLEVPVAYAVENHGINRKRATWLIGGLITLISTVIIFNFESLFGLTIRVTTRYSQPLLGISLCVFAGWIWQRNQLLEEVKQGFEGVAHGIRGRFYGATELVQLLQEAKQALKLNELLFKLDRYRFIIIDDIGYVSRDQQETSVLFELITHRYERASLIITANQSFSQWDKIFADKSMTVAAVDRLIHHSHIIELEGEESYRRKTAQKRRETTHKTELN